MIRNESRLVQWLGAGLLFALLITVWMDRFLPMQDYPQHLFMAKVAATYDDPRLDWRENFEFRGSFGPYRATFLAQSAIGRLIGVEAAGKVLVSFYVISIGLLAWIIYRQRTEGEAGWGALLCFPLCFHAMYFYGFLNFTLSMPLLVLMLLHLQRLQSAPHGKVELAGHGLMVLGLFLLHPFTLLVYMVLALAMSVWAWRHRRACLEAFAMGMLALGLFLAWSAYDSVVTESGREFTIDSLNMKWWPLEWNLQFLAMQFTGMNIRSQPDWRVAGLWFAVAILLLAGLWRWRTVGGFRPLFAVLAILIMGGFFALPFSVVMDNRYTFFNARMAPIALMVMLPFIAAIPFGRWMGRALAVVAVSLTLFSIHLHHRVAEEVAEFVAIFEPLEPNARILPLVSLAPSSIMDPFFYAQFQSNMPFYYHVIKGGGVNPDLFAARLMPVAYKAGRRPGRPSQRQLQRWKEFAAGYDYVLTRRVPQQVVQELGIYGRLVNSAGPWRLIRLNK